MRGLLKLLGILSDKFKIDVSFGFNYFLGGWDNVGKLGEDSELLLKIIR